MRALGRLWDQAPREAREVARQVGYVLGAELRAHGVDLGLAPGTRYRLRDQQSYRRPRIPSQSPDNYRIGPRASTGLA